MTGFSHAKLLFNRELRTLLPELPLRNADNQGDHHRQARLQDNQMKKKMADYANSKCTRKPSTLKVGDVVLLQNNSRLKNKMEPSYFPQQLIVTKKRVVRSRQPAREKMLTATAHSFVNSSAVILSLRTAIKSQSLLVTTTKPKLICNRTRRMRRRTPQM